MSCQEMFHGKNAKLGKARKIQYPPRTKVMKQKVMTLKKKKKNYNFNHHVYYFFYFFCLIFITFVLGGGCIF